MIAITIPARTNTTIAICIQNQWRGIQAKPSNRDASHLALTMGSDGKVERQR